MSEHSVLLAVQRQVQGLIEEKTALKNQVAGLVAENTAKQTQIDGLVAERDELRRFERYYYSESGEGGQP